MPIVSLVAPQSFAAFTLDAETYPIDLVSGATGAWSTRKLSASYTGNLLKVRRSSDDTTLDIGSSGFYLDFQAIQAFVGANNGFFDTWNDQSGNARNITQATLLQQPLLLTSGSYYTDLGGYPAAEFTATPTLDSAVNASSFITTTAGTIFAVVIADTTTGVSTPAGRAIWGQSGGNAVTVFQNGPQATAFTYDGSYHSATATGLSTGTPYVVVWRLSSGNIEIYVNSDTVVATAATGAIASLASPLRIGGAGGSSTFDGRIAEIICYNTALSSGDLNTVGQSMASPYGITWV